MNRETETDLCTLMGLGDPDQIPKRVRKMCSCNELMLMRKGVTGGPKGNMLITIINACGINVVQDELPKTYDWWPVQATTSSSSDSSGPVVEEGMSETETKEEDDALAASNGKLIVTDGKVNWAKVEKGTKLMANWHGKRFVFFEGVEKGANKAQVKMEDGFRRMIALEKLSLDFD